MDRKDFDRALAQGSIPCVLLFEGEEEQLKQDALTALRRAVLQLFVVHGVHPTM